MVTTGPLLGRDQVPKNGFGLKQARLARLSPVLVQDVLRVGGRLKNSWRPRKSVIPITRMILGRPSQCFDTSCA